MANTAIAANYLFVQPLMAQRLRECEPALLVRGVDSMDRVLASELRQPMAFVLWEGERFKDQARAGGSVLASQRFSVLLALGNAQQDDDAPLNTEAGLWLARIHQALAGWAPAQLLGRSFRRTNGRSPSYSPNAGIYPLTFEIDVNL